MQAACRGMNRDEPPEREGGGSPSITLFPRVAHPVSFVVLLNLSCLLNPAPRVGLLRGEHIGLHSRTSYSLVKEAGR